jgi:two-component system, sensor histidine kinase PdtaS
MRCRFLRTAKWRFRHERRPWENFARQRTPEWVLAPRTTKPLRKLGARFKYAVSILGSGTKSRSKRCSSDDEAKSIRCRANRRQTPPAYSYPHRYGEARQSEASTRSFLNQAVVQVARATEIHHVKVLQFRQRTGDLLMVAGIGWKAGVVGSATFPVNLRSPPGRAFLTAEPVAIADTGAQNDYVISSVLVEHGIVSLANVPILIDGAAWGVLEVDSAEPCDFGEETLEFLTAAAAMMGTMARRLLAEEGKAVALAEVRTQAVAREILLDEMQHRIKNNFQFILSSLSQQKRRFKEPDVQRALDHVASRVSAVSLAHDQLSFSQEVHVVDMVGYLRALCSSVEQQTDGVGIDVEADQLEVPVDRAVPVGLIVNELITNSVKHAFGADGGRITVKLNTGIGVGEARLSIADNGRGIQDPTARGSGLKLIASLARQIGGEVEQTSSEKGTTTTLTFPAFG